MMVAGRFPDWKSFIVWKSSLRSRPARLGGTPPALLPFVPWHVKQFAARLRPAFESWASDGSAGASEKSAERPRALAYEDFMEGSPVMQRGHYNEKPRLSFRPTGAFLMLLL